MSAAEHRHFHVIQHLQPRDPLLARAQRAHPDSDYLQREWLRAVRVVRSTSRGWVCDLHHAPTNKGAGHDAR